MSDYPFYFTWAQQHSPAHFPIISVKGAKIYTEGGRDLIDLSSISYQASFGHNHPTIIERMKRQLDTIPMSAPKGIFPGKKEITLDLLNYMERPEGKIFYTTGGAETVENALKIARDFTQKKLVLARQVSYHGATLGALTATGDWRNQAHAIPENWVLRIPEPSEKDALLKTRKIILEAGPENIAGLIIETITGGNGVYMGSEEWWKGLSDLCREFKILLILDEVVCGFGRTGRPFGYMHYSLKPDLICMAKGITGGMFPFGAVWTSPQIAAFYEERVLACGLTNYAHPVGLAAMSGVLEIVKDPAFVLHQKKISLLFQEKLNELQTLSIVDEVRVKGLLAAVDLNVDVKWKTFFDHGLHLASQNKKIVLAPPLIISEQDLIEGMARFKQALTGN